MDKSVNIILIFILTSILIQHQSGFGSNGVHGASPITGSSTPPVPSTPPGPNTLPGSSITPYTGGGSTTTESEYEDYSVEPVGSSVASSTGPGTSGTPGPGTGSTTGANGASTTSKDYEYEDDKVEAKKDTNVKSDEEIDEIFGKMYPYGDPNRTIPEDFKKGHEEFCKVAPANVDELRKYMKAKHGDKPIFSTFLDKFVGGYQQICLSVCINIDPKAWPLLDKQAKIINKRWQQFVPEREKIMKVFANASDPSAGNPNSPMTIELLYCYVENYMTVQQSIFPSDNGGQLAMNEYFDEHFKPGMDYLKETFSISINFRCPLPELKEKPKARQLKFQPKSLQLAFVNALDIVLPKALIKLPGHANATGNAGGASTIASSGATIASTTEGIAKYNAPEEEPVIVTSSTGSTGATASSTGASSTTNTIESSSTTNETGASSTTNVTGASSTTNGTEAEPSDEEEEDEEEEEEEEGSSTAGSLSSGATPGGSTTTGGENGSSSSESEEDEEEEDDDEEEEDESSSTGAASDGSTTAGSGSGSSTTESEDEEEEDDGEEEEEEEEEEEGSTTASSLSSGATPGGSTAAGGESGSSTTASDEEYEDDEEEDGSSTSSGSSTTGGAPGGSTTTDSQYEYEYEYEDKSSTTSTTKAA